MVWQTRCTIVDCGGLWWTIVDYGGLWWTVVHYGALWWTIVDCGGLWWTMVDYGGLWWTMVVHVCGFFPLYRIKVDFTLRCSDLQLFFCNVDCILPVIITDLLYQSISRSTLKRVFWIKRQKKERKRNFLSICRVDLLVKFLRNFAERNFYLFPSVIFIVQFFNIFSRYMFWDFYFSIWIFDRILGVKILYFGSIILPGRRFWSFYGDTLDGFLNF